MDSSQPIRVVLADDHQVVRHGIRDCEICGFPHIHHDPKVDYRAVVIASEPITHETWSEIPERSAFRAGPDFALRTEPVFPDVSYAAATARSAES